MQSILPKLDVLFSELCDFDILAFSESWLNPAVTDDNLSFVSYAINLSAKTELEIAMEELFFMLKTHCIIQDEGILSQMVLNAYG